MTKSQLLWAPLPIKGLAFYLFRAAVGTELPLVRVESPVGAIALSDSTFSMVEWALMAADKVI